MPKKTRRVGVLTAVAAVGLMLGTSMQTKAAIVLTNETQLSAGNQVLSAPGPDNTQFTNPLNIAYSGGTASFSGPLGYVERRTQTDGVSGSWAGDFAPGDPLFFTGAVDEPLQLRFSSDVSEVGAQIQPFFSGGFTGNIIAYDVTENVIGTFSVTGTSTTTGDNSATFIGIRTSPGDAAIRRVLFSTPGYGSAINQVSFATNAAPDTAPVPEPSTYAMFGMGLLALVAIQGRKRQAYGYGFRI